MLRDSSSLDTIVAPATPTGRSALALVRISGSDAVRILLALAPALSEPPPQRRPTLVSLKDAAGETIDRGLATLFAAPASSTGEDVVELSVHGSPAVVERLLTSAAEAGARLARPGEFTERAFRSGKIDLLRAEAIRDLIEARTPAAARLSACRLEGALSRRLGGIREHLLAACAGLEAAIDFAEDVGERLDPAVEARLCAALGELERLISSYRTGRLLSVGCRVAILGRPNAGKSTLFNALLGTGRAIVTEIPGTTRDALEGSIDVRGIPVTLVDTAGLHSASDPVERLGVERAREEGRRADAILYVFDASLGWTDEDEAVWSHGDSPRALVANKADRLPAGWSPTPSHAVPLCGLSEGAGAALRELLGRTIADGVKTEETSEVLSTLRQRDLVERARLATRDARVALAEGLSPEYAVTHCHAALDALAGLVGETTSEDVLRELFATFCIGK